MAFRDNILKKILIDKLTQQVRQSIGLPDSGQRLDQDTMRRLLALGPFEHRQERDLNLYFIRNGGSKPMILVLDNELKIYDTTVDDVVLRKSPTVKEMISVRNAIKILNDNKVVAYRKADTLDQIRSKIIDTMDLSYTAKDIDILASDGRAALQNNYEEGLTEVLAIFAELLDFQKAPKSFQLTHHLIWGRLSKSSGGEKEFGPMVLFNRMHNLLMMIDSAFSNLDKAAMQRFHQIAKGDTEVEIKGEKVLDALYGLVMRSAK
jgi:hypothetical protein